MNCADDRDPELRDVLDEISKRLAAIEPIRGHEQDAALTVVETYCGPYALAFFHEIERLDTLIAKLRSKLSEGKE